MGCLESNPSGAGRWGDVGKKVAELRYLTVYAVGAAEAQAFPSAHSATRGFLAEEQKGHLEAAIPQTARGKLANAHLPKPNS